MAACHVERSETFLISAAEERFKDNLEILRFAQNDIDTRAVKHASSPPTGPTCPVASLPISQTGCPLDESGKDA